MPPAPVSKSASGSQAPASSCRPRSRQSPTTCSPTPSSTRCTRRWSYRSPSWSWPPRRPSSSGAHVERPCRLTKNKRPWPNLLPTAKKLAEYEAKRDFQRTPEPGAKVPRKETKAPRFVVQAHHARRLHWDFRLEKDGVGASWAVPNGIRPNQRKTNLAAHGKPHP